VAIREAIGQLVEGRSLSEADAAAAMVEIADGLATPAQIAAFAVALRMKGETAEEIAGLARVMRERATRVALDGEAIDVVGTGGDGARTFNISTLAALVVAAAGGRVAKHGNRGVTSGCGSADLLEALGVAIDLRPAQVAACVRRTGFGFMFAPLYHPAMRHAVAPRREIGVRTVFNVLGPLTNPAWVSGQLTGVAVPGLGEKVVEVHRRLGSRRAIVVHGVDGLDELSVSAATLVYELRDGTVRSYELTPEVVGLRRAPAEAVRGGTVAANVAFAERVLAGERGPARDVVLLNAGAALVVAGLVDDVAAGVRCAAAAIDSGAAAAKLDEVRSVSQALRREQGD
jgi:anthranilate phosphoribosyltransferase